VHWKDSCERAPKSVLRMEQLYPMQWIKIRINLQDLYLKIVTRQINFLSFDSFT